ncbi:hypothetical protein BT69DRAFT_1276197 [Atractiella rhizophila]|nr:hypothetical protein BT69DRAFT_1276197 [Atractiella rhizophila]
MDRRGQFKHYIRQPDQQTRERQPGTGMVSRRSKQSRKIIIAAIFPEFYTLNEVDKLWDIADKERDDLLHRTGTPNAMPHFNRVNWKLRSGEYEAIRWAGSQPADLYRSWTWWLLGVFSSLLNEWPEDSMCHLLPCSYVHLAISKATGVYKEIVRA